MMTRRPVLIASLVSLFAGACARPQDARLAGVWTGILLSRGQRLHLRLEIKPDGATTVHSLDQNAKVPARAKMTGAGDVTVDILMMGVSFNGRLASADKIEGIWRQGPAETPIFFLRGEAGLTAPLASAKAAVAQPLTQSALESLLKQADAPAFGAAAARGQGAPRMWVAGVRMRGAQTPVSTADSWHVGSISKSMLATVVGALVDEGKLSWDDTAGDVLGALYPQMLPAYRGATFKHFLSHRAGLARDLSVLEMTAILAANSDTAAQTRAVLSKAFSMAPIAALGAQTSYSNIDYMVVGAMLQEKLGQDWRALMRAKLFEPLQLKTAGFGAPGASGALDQPAGHGEVFGAPYHTYPPGDARGDLPEVWGPAGRVHMSMGDLLIYLAAHRDRAALLKSETWDTLHRPPFGGDYALGWVVRPDGALWHSGSNQRWYAEVEFNAQTGVVAAAIANDGRAKIYSYVANVLERAAAAV